MGRRGLASIAVVFLFVSCGGEPGDAGSEEGAGGTVGPGGSGGVGGTGGEGGTGGAGGAGGTVDPDAPRIDSLVPDHGLPGTVTELRGQRLRGTREQLVLFRPGVAARLLAAGQDGTWIRAVVPVGAESGPVRVRLDGESHSGPSFTVEEGSPVPSIERIRPDYVRAGVPGATVELEGFGFFSSSRLYFGEEELAPTSLTETVIRVFLPEALLSTPGRRSFRVENQAPGGGIAEIPFQVSGPFNVVSAEALSQTSVRVVFDQRLDPESASSQFHYKLDCFT